MIVEQTTEPAAHTARKLEFPPKPGPLTIRLSTTSPRTWSHRIRDIVNVIRGPAHFNGNRVKQKSRPHLDDF